MVNWPGSSLFSPAITAGEIRHVDFTVLSSLLLPYHHLCPSNVLVDAMALEFLQRLKDHRRDRGLKDSEELKMETGWRLERWYSQLGSLLYP